MGLPLRFSKAGDQSETRRMQEVELELGMIQMSEEGTPVFMCVFVHTCTCACSTL